jgi:RND superfamily putative drug exporter
MTDPFARLGLFIVRWRWVVLAVWLVVLIALGGLLAPKAPKALKGGGFIDPDSESARAATILDREFNASTFTSSVVVFRSISSTVDDPTFKDQVTRAAEQLSTVHGVRSVQTFYTSDNPLLVSNDRHTTFALVPLEGNEGDIQELVPDLRASIKGAPLEHYLTGTPAVNSDLQSTSEDDLQRSEKFTVPIVVILLLLVFRTVVAAFLPLLIGACSIVMALGAMYLVSTQTEVSIFALNVTTMIGLGLGIDFSLVLANRFREELARGRSVADAVSLSMSTAGRSITYSALTVLLAMFVLTLLFNLLVVRSISMGVMLVAFTGLLAGVTLLPALLAILGHRIEWLRVVPRRRRDDNHQSASTGFWYRLSMAVMRRPWIWLAVSLGILLILALPVRELTLYGATPDIMPPDTESTHGAQLMSQAFGQSRLTPIQIVLTAPGKNGVWKPEFLSALKRVSDSAQADPRNDQVFSLVSLANTAGLPPDKFSSLTLNAVEAVPGAAAVLPQFVNSDRNNDIAVITVFSNYDRFSKEHQAFISHIRDNILPPIRQSGAVADTYVGGDGAIFIDFRDATARRLPLLVLGVTGVTFIMLLMFFQSVFLPLKAILLNFASILATYGVMTTVFQYGWGDRLLGFTSLGGLGMFAPAILFSILFGLSTDYEVFMLSRVKEYFHQTRNNEEAVARGLQNTAGVITAAGLILVGTFGSFATANVVAVKEIGIGLAVGVFLDSTIVRVIMVPATMRLMGNANWWMPAWLKRIVPELKEGPSGDVLPGFAQPIVEPQPAASNGAAAHPLPSFNVGHLRALSGSIGADDIVLLKTRPLRIGRDESNDLQFFDDGISRFHARVDYDAVAGTHVIVDLGSTNGVYVNGRRIAAQPASSKLRDGDRLEMGGSTEVVLVYEVRPLGSERVAEPQHSVGV